MSLSRFVRAYPPAAFLPESAAADNDQVARQNTEAIWLPFQNGDLLAQASAGGDGLSLLRGSLPSAPWANARLIQSPPLYLGTLDGVPCLACAVAADTTIPPLLRAVGLRALWGQVPDEEYGLTGYALQLLHWQRASGFCPACAQATEAVAGVWARRCPACGHSAYPPVSPAVLILVHDGADRILLAHKPGWGKRYSILAGFVEPGESLEGCVHREAYEEAGLKVADLVYTGSQPWPFPHQVMIGFYARCTDSEIPLRLDETELDHAAWFPVDALPELPGALSLSRQMIDAWVASRQR